MFYNDLSFPIFVTEVQRLADEDAINWELYFFPEFTTYFLNTLNALYDEQFSPKDAYDDIVKSALWGSAISPGVSGDGAP